MSVLDAASGSWWSWVFETGWQSGLVGLALLAVALGFRKLPAPLRYGLLVVALVKFAVPPVIGVPVSGPAWLAAGTVEQELDPTAAEQEGEHKGLEGPKGLEEQKRFVAAGPAGVAGREPRPHRGAGFRSRNRPHGRNQRRSECRRCRGERGGYLAGLARLVVDSALGERGCGGRVSGRGILAAAAGDKVEPESE